jgi:hypothetical protein
VKLTRLSAAVCAAVLPAATVLAVAVAGPASAASVPACSASALRVHLGSGSPGAGSTLYALYFTKTTKGTCRLTGFPGVAGLSTKGARVGVQAGRRGSTVTVTLKDGKTATAWLREINTALYSHADCKPKPLKWLGVYAPNTRTRKLVPASKFYPGCSTKQVYMRVTSVGGRQGAA